MVAFSTADTFLDQTICM